MSGVDTAMLARAQGLMSRFSSLTPAPNVFRMTETPDGTNAAFPVQLGSTDPEDRKYALRQQLVGNDGQVAKVGLAVADDQFFNYANRKEEQAILYDFYRFMFSQADLTKPESAQWWFSKFPWMRDMRVQEIEKQADLQKTLARIGVTGPESEDDFMLMYLIRNGTLVPPTKPLWQMGTQTEGVATSYKEGFFSRLSNGTIFNNATGGSFNQPPGALGGQGDANMGIKWDHPVPSRMADTKQLMDQYYKAPTPASRGIAAFPTSLQGLFGWTNT